jgi:hypothetical protein
MSVIGDQPVLWVSVKSLLASGPYSETNMELWNHTLVETCARYPNMRVFDWASVAKDSWFISDGTHYIPCLRWRGWLGLRRPLAGVSGLDVCQVAGPAIQGDQLPRGGIGRTSRLRASTYLGLGIAPLCFQAWVRISGGAREGRLTVAKLIYSVITSLDGYVADEDGNFDWAAPDEEVHTFVNDLERKVGTYLYGRRMYEVMRYWETAHTLTDLPAMEQDYAKIWRAADKVVYSKTLVTVSSARTRIERDFDPEAVRRMKARQSKRAHR